MESVELCPDGEFALATARPFDFQLKAINEYASCANLHVSGYFGGTYESAKTDGRKFFARMFEYMKQSKGAASHILVYALDRFSRTGAGAIKLAEELHEKYGVAVFAVTQPADTSNPSGVLQQSIHFIFSQYDNQLHKQRAAGTKEKLERGIWCVRVPMCYDKVKSEGQTKIVINTTGKKLRKAFIWKSQGTKNEPILEKLRAMGVGCINRSSPFCLPIHSTAVLSATGCSAIPCSKARMKSWSVEMSF